MSGARHWEQDKEATVYIGNLDERITDSLVWELMLQAGHIVNVHLPKDRVTQTHQGYGFVEFISEEDADYAARIMNQVRLFGKPIRVNKASADKQKTVEIGAELFIGNLDPMVSEQTLYETFSRFGALAAVPKVARDDTNLSKGYGFVSFSDFDASDDAIANLHGQYLMNKEISVEYAYKKDGKGERHGDQAERMLAAEAKKNNTQPILAPMPPHFIPGQPSQSVAQGTDHDSYRGTMLPTHQIPGATAGRAGSQIIGTPQATQSRFASHTQPLPPPPPSGLPARPPPSQAGYGGPQGFVPPGFSVTSHVGLGQQPQAPGFPPVFQAFHNAGSR